MRPGVDSVSRRLIWLIIAIGALASLGALLNGLFTSGSGISLPFTRTPLDGGWLFVFGLMWLIVGVTLFFWVRPVALQTDADEPLHELENLLEKRFAEFQSAQELRLTELQAQVKRLEAQLASQHNNPTVTDTLDSIGKRLAALESSVERTNSRIERISVANAGALNVDHELGNLATTLQDVHERLDNLSDVHSRLDDLTSQVDALYVTLQDIHHRLDVIEGHGKPR